MLGGVFVLLHVEWKFRVDWPGSFKTRKLKIFQIADFLYTGSFWGKKNDNVVRFSISCRFHPFLER